MLRRSIAAVRETVSLWSDRLWPGGVSARQSVGNVGQPVSAGPLRDSRALSILDALPDAALLLDHDLTVLHGNARARALLGQVRIDEHISRTSRHPELAAALAQTQRSAQPATFEFVLREAVERHLDGTATDLATSRNDPGAREILVILQDLSEREALARTRVEFVANASHELRTPLASLSGFIETLAGPARDDPAARDRFLMIMAEQAARMTRLIDDLLLLSRVEMRAHVQPTGRVDLNAVLADASKPLARAAQASGKTLRIAPSPVPIIVLGEHDELLQAVQNLIQNALKYGVANGTVQASIAVASEVGGQPGWVQIRISDDGPGIASEHLPRLTERFYRVSTSASREKGGTGLGLAIVKHIAARHRGKLAIESELGKGSTFTIALPMAAAPGDGERGGRQRAA